MSNVIVPIKSPWALSYMTSVESNIISLTVLNIFHVKKYDLDF